MKKASFVSLALGVMLAIAGGFASQAQARKAPKAQAEPARPAGQVVEYAELESRVGQTVSIDTTFKTTRTGKLVKFTQPTLTLDTGTAEHPVEFTVPKETIKTITVLTPADAGTSGAKKN